MNAIQSAIALSVLIATLVVLVGIIGHDLYSTYSLQKAEIERLSAENRSLRRQVDRQHQGYLDKQRDYNWAMSLWWKERKVTMQLRSDLNHFLGEKV